MPCVKNERRNQRSLARRLELMKSSSSTRDEKQLIVWTGPEATPFVHLSTRLRASKEDEKKAVAGSKTSGLNVRDDIYESVIQCVQRLKEGCACQDLETDNLGDLTLLSVVRRCVELGALAIDLE